MSPGNEGGLRYPEADKVHGRAAKLLMRPHDLEIHPRRNGRPTLLARVSRVLTTAPRVKIGLLDGGGASIHVEMAHDRFQDMHLQLGRVVYLSLREARVFVEEADYSI